MRSEKESGSSGGSKNWPNALMFGLLYPAVLGTFFYSLLPETLQFIRAPMQMDFLQGTKLVLSFLLIAHFLIDFYFTQQVALQTDNYPPIIFALDLLIVLSLFVAYDTVHLDEKGTEPEVRWTAGAMFVSYILFRVWEYKMRGVIGTSRGLSLYESGAAAVFLILWVAWPNVVGLALALLASALLMFFVGGPVVERFHQAQPIDKRTAGVGHPEGVELAANPGPKSDA